jgi:hypothetical protein
MANYTNLINSIQAVIKQNGTNDITGQLMQDVLVAMTNSIGRFATFAGVASPTTNPGTIDQNVFFLASVAGTYPNFGGAVVPSGKIVAFDNVSGSWNMSVVVTISGGAITIDIDPTLDLNSVNPVENRAVTGAINGLDSRVTALEGTLGLTIKQEFLSVAQAEALNGTTYLGKKLLACNFQAAGIYSHTFFNPIQVATGNLYMMELRTGTTFYANVSYVNLTNTVTLADILGVNASIQSGNNWVIYAE